MDNLVRVPDELLTIMGALGSAGYFALIVGGAVRDALLGIAPKDFDTEVYGIAYEQLSEFLSRRGTVDLVGKSFGVIKFSDAPGRQWDFSVPRRDNKIGVGHRDFRITFDPKINAREAAARRDFTMNALAYDPVRQELHDYCGGRADLGARVLRATSAAFGEDPLRVLRGMQFACRFDMSVEAATTDQCRFIADQYHTLARERVCEEFVKWAVRSTRPGRMIEYLGATGWLRHFPLIERMVGVPQDPEWHPEGDVATHTMHVVDAAAAIARREQLDEENRAVLLFAALTHDIAKSETTELREKEGRLRWTSHGHEKAGGPRARTFLEGIGIKAQIVDQVAPLVEHHLAHINFRDADVRARTVRRLAARLVPANIRQLAWLMEADHSGRPPLPAGMPDGARQILDLASSQHVESAPQPALILGRDVMPYFDNKPGAHIGEVVRAAYEAQMEGAFTTKADALNWLAEHMAGRAARDPEPPVRD